MNQSVKEGQLKDAAVQLVMALNRAADENLPGKLAGMVKMHAGIAVGCIFVPIPGADLLAAAGNTWTMYARINKEIGLPFSKNVVRSLATGVLTNIASNAVVVAVIVLGNSLKLMPGPGTAAGIAVMSATIYGVTIAAGYVYMKALAQFLKVQRDGKDDDFSLKNAIDEVMKDKKTVETVFRDAKESYTKDDTDLNALAYELAELKSHMQSLATTPEHIDALGEVAKAEMFAQRNDVKKTFERLKKSGDWTLEVAQKHELQIAEAALQTFVEQSDAP